MAKKNTITVKERNANYRLANADKAQQAHKEWRTLFPKKRKASKIRTYWPHLSSKEALTEYDKLFLNQSGCCAVCKRHQEEFKRALAVDHCHITGKVRGLLCGGCNTCLGHVKDSIDLLNVLVSYLKEHL